MLTPYWCGYLIIHTIEPTRAPISEFEYKSHTFFVYKSFTFWDLSEQNLNFVMRNLLFSLSIFIILFSCSSNDDNSNTQNGASINPPTWIQGTWLKENPTTGYKFTTNDFCLELPQQESCFKDQLEQTRNAGGTAEASETITESSYSIEINIISQTYIYEFEKISDTQIELTNDPLGDLAQTIFTKQ